MPPRRPFLYDRYFFVTVALRKSRRRLQDPDFERLAYALARMRGKYGFLLTAWVFLPDHWHAIIYPPYPLTISRVFQAVKVSSMIAINVRLGESGELWQGRLFDRALRTVKTSEVSCQVFSVMSRLLLSLSRGGHACQQRRSAPG